MKRKLLLTAILSVGAFCINAHADDVFKDVTSTYLTNADFEGNFSVYSNPNPNDNRAIYQPEGWTVTYTNGDSNDMTILNMNCESSSNFSQQATNPNGGANTYWIRMRWGTGAMLKLSQEVTLPMGKYSISADYFKNGSGGDGYIFVGSTEKNTNVNENVWKNLTIDYTSDGFTATTIGCYAKHTNTYEKFLAFDNFVIQWNLTQSLSMLISDAQGYLNEDPTNTNLEEAIEEANNKVNSTNAEELEEAYNNLASVCSLLESHSHWVEVKETAEAALTNTDYDNVTGSERTDLEAETNKAEPTTLEGYSTAIEALETATNAFIAAKDAYDALVTAKADAAAYTTEAWPYASSEKKTALDNAVGAADPTTAADAETKANAIVTAYRQFVESNGKAEGVDGAKDFTSYLSGTDASVSSSGWTGSIGTNSGEGYTDGDGNVSTKYFDGGWSNSAGANINLSQNVTLPAGKYLLQITARGSDALNTYTLSVGEESINLPHISSSGGTFGRGWSDKWLYFESDGSQLTISIIANSTDYYQWISFDRIRLYQLEEIEVPMADEDDYAALATAITAAEVNVLGFDQGEYAPYNNVAALEALAAAKAIDPEKEGGNTKEVVQSVTTALTEATWTANSAEVNGVYNGTWALSTQNNVNGENVDAKGWTLVEGLRKVFNDVTAYPGLEYSDGHAGAFAWGGTTITYGQTTGYTLPLNEYSYYELSFKMCGWIDGDLPTYISASLLKGEDGDTFVPSNVNITKRISDTDGDPFVTFTFNLKTGAVGDYVLSIFANKHYVITDINLVKSTPITIDNNFSLAAGKYATRIYPFAPQAIEGINFYSCAAAEGNTLTLVPVETPQACVPYILGNDGEDASEAISITQTGVDIHDADTYTEGFLTGVFAATTVPVGSYVLQTQNDKQAFYKVNGEFTINTPYRAYLSVDSSVKAFNLGVDDATAINTLDVLTNGSYEAIYSADGKKLNNLEKGVNILKMADGSTHKVIVK